MRTTTPADRRPPARAAFTLVELLVAVAVIMLIMTVLSSVFSTGMETMRMLRSTGDLVDQLRAGSEVIKRDLQAPHYLDEDNKPNQGLRVSDQRIDQLANNGSGAFAGWTPPRGGFFRVRSSPVTVEGLDADNMQSTRATDHYLHFTSVIKASDPNPYTATTLTGSALSSRAAEIAYFLDPVPTGYAGSSVPTFNLIRRQRLVAVADTDRVLFPTGDPAVVSVYFPPTGGSAVNSMTDLADPGRRMGGPSRNLPRPPNPGGRTWSIDGGLATTQPWGLSTPNVALDGRHLSPLGNRLGDDVLLSNVISFEVRVCWITGPGSGVAGPRPFGTTVRNPTATPPVPGLATGGTDNGEATSDSPYDSLPLFTPGAVPNNGGNNLQTNAGGNGHAFVFDTWGATVTTPPPSAVTPGPQPDDPNWAWNSTTPNPKAIPLRVRVVAVQIKLRVWDPKMRITRQMTMVVDL